MTDYLAIDLGAESGRAILGHFDGQQITLSEIHRFPNRAVRVGNDLQWDILGLWAEVQAGIGKAADIKLAGIGIDTWAVDFGLLDRSGRLLANPFCYRDSRTEGMIDAAFARMPRERIYEITGIQFLPLNTLYQLLAMVEANSPLFEIAETFLTIPDLLNYWLTGRAVCEFTNATTTQCFDTNRRAWSGPLLAAMGIPRRIFPEVVMPGTVLGEVQPGLGTNAPVIAPACHDTGSAVVAVPAEGEGFAWISSGTWSVVGTNVPEPVITPESLAHNFTNEGGAGGSYRFSRNVMGLWIVQECRRTWAGEGDALSYAELTEMAAGANPLASLIDPDDARFFAPGDMPARIRDYCRETGQPVPETKAAVVRCALESIALKYRWVLERLEEMVEGSLEPLHIVGGGTQNELLSQFTADATGRPVITGPVEATAVGNLLMQALAQGDIGAVEDAAAIVRASFEIKSFEPKAPWDDAYRRLLDMMA